MKATAIMKSGLASSPAYSDAVFEIDITVSIMANANRGETLPFLSMVSSKSALTRCATTLLKA